MIIPAPFPCSFAAPFDDLPVIIGQVVFFRADEEDGTFLRQLYRTTRDDEMAATNWSDADKQGFCDRQFDLQHIHYTRHHPEGAFLVLKAGAEKVGRLYVDGSGEAVHLVDLSLLPQWQDRGIGSAVLAEVQRCAAAAGKPVTLNVLAGNWRAVALYRRVGFVPGAFDGTYVTMRWAS